MVLTQFSAITKILRFDLGGEYLLFEFTEFLAGNGTTHQSVRNGRTERKHRHLLDIA